MSTNNRKLVVDYYLGNAEPLELPNEQRVVLATPKYLNAGPGDGITRDDIDSDDLVEVGSLSWGDVVFFESPKADDCLDDTDEATEKSTHIWWRAIIVE